MQTHKGITGLPTPVKVWELDIMPVVHCCTMFIADLRYLTKSFRISQDLFKIYLTDLESNNEINQNNVFMHF